MIFKNINRRCGHEEQIGIAGFSGTLDNIPDRFQDACLIGIMEQENRVCLPCLKKLSKEEQRKEMDRFI
jgi:hypothetical protein